MLTIVTIVLDGMPFIQHHLPIFQSLEIPWEWKIAEGTAGNTGSTQWCRAQHPRLSVDGTTEYLNSIHDPRVQIFRSTHWPNKDVMINSLLSKIKEPCVLLEVDADEVHTPENIEKIHSLFTNNEFLGVIRMPCRYFVGPDLICVGENCWSNRFSEWERAWRYKPGDIFIRHEPPTFSIQHGRSMSREESKLHGLTFDHFAYATEQQALYKEIFYGYYGLAANWRRLQAHQEFPVSLDKFFPFAHPSPMVERI
jgi:hypothetical protein